MTAPEMSRHRLTLISNNWPGVFCRNVYFSTQAGMRLSRLAGRQHLAQFRPPLALPAEFELE